MSTDSTHAHDCKMDLDVGDRAFVTKTNDGIGDINMEDSEDTMMATKSFTHTYHSTPIRQNPRKLPQQKNHQTAHTLNPSTKRTAHPDTEDGEDDDANFDNDDEGMYDDEDDNHKDIQERRDRELIHRFQREPPPTKRSREWYHLPTDRRGVLAAAARALTRKEAIAAGKTPPVTIVNPYSVYPSGKPRIQGRFESGVGPGPPVPWG